MLRADEQDEIIRANRAAFEELARTWRDPQTGSPQPNLEQATIAMVCDYFSVPGLGDNRLFDLLSEISVAAHEEDARALIELTDENQIPDHIRARLKQLGPDHGTSWDWDTGEWDWELSLRNTQTDRDCGYVAIVGLKGGRRYAWQVKPPSTHQEWALRFVCDDVAVPDILIRGSLHQAKRWLDALLGINTPELPGLDD